jgi:rubrerythrin
MNDDKIRELLYQAFETEQGGVQIYKTAIECAQNKEVKEEWEEYLGQTERHVEVVRGLLEEFGLDPEEETPGRKVVRHIGESLVKAMELAQRGADPAAAEIVAAECVVLAETKDHHNWELIGLLAEKIKGDRGKRLKEAHREVEDEEDEHLYHTQGWARELTIQSLGMKAVLPPPEEKKDVKTAIGAARAKKARTAAAK